MIREAAHRESVAYDRYQKALNVFKIKKIQHKEATLILIRAVY